MSMSKKKDISIYEYYEKLLNNKQEWFRFGNKKLLEEVDIRTLFSEIPAKNFIRMMFFYENMVKLIPKANFVDNRESHTVSAFLLGIILKENLQLSTRSLPKILPDYHQSFVYFWSMICLSHDLTYIFENDHSYNHRCQTADDYVRHFGLKHNLLDVSKYADLFRNYYSYRINEFNCMDHGITCGLLLYNLLMTDYEDNMYVKEHAVLYSGDPFKFSKDYKDYIVRICETIARHNLWVANSKTISLYEKYELYSLIPTDSDFHHIAYSEQESLLFLLGLVDTLEPIKCYKKEGTMDFYDVLKSIRLSCSYNNKRIHLCCDEPFSDQMISCWKGMEDWMALKFKAIEDNKHVIISFEYERENDNIFAA